MPLFEYQCRDCGKPFETFVTKARQPECPSCQGTNLLKMLSSPGMVGVAASRETAPCGNPNMPMCGGGGCGCMH